MSSLEADALMGESGPDFCEQERKQKAKANLHKKISLLE